VTTLYYRSRDKERNQEGANSQVFKIDTQPPESTLIIGQPQTAGDPLTIEVSTPLTLTAKDTTSGVQSVAYRFFPQGGKPTAYVTTLGDTVQFQVAGPEGIYEVHTFASDVAGNDEKPHVQLVRLPAPTAISVAHLTATQESNRVVIRWETGAEINTTGFHIYRGADNNRSNAARITQEMLTAKGNPTNGASYSWEDPNAKPEQHYYYWLEEVEQGGATNQYGPILAIRPLSSVYLPFVER